LGSGFWWIKQKKCKLGRLNKGHQKETLIFTQKLTMPLKTLVLGASSNPERYSYKAVNMLMNYGHPVVALGARKEMIGQTPILIGFPAFDSIDTITLYIGSARQKEYYEYLLGLNPRRIIFNPGTSNAEFRKLALENNIEVEEACTLVLLSTNQFEN
jgi:predicted CoA-binding protein